MDEPARSGRSCLFYSFQTAVREQFANKEIYGNKYTPNNKDHA